jgi:hypothetical protein
MTMRRAIAVAVSVAALAACEGKTDEPLVQHTCLVTSSGQCGVYVLPESWPADVRGSCESHGGTWDVPCPVNGRVGFCSCAGADGISTGQYYYDPIWTPTTASASCADNPYCHFVP